MVRYRLIALVVFCWAVQLQAQEKWGVDVESWMNVRMLANNSGVDVGKNGAGIGVGFERGFKSTYNYQVSGEFGAAGVGNYLGTSFGISRDIFLKSRTSNAIEASVLQGLALFKPTPIYMYGVEIKNTLDIPTKNKTGPGVILALRYYHFPGYATYSAINSFVDIRLGFRYLFYSSSQHQP